MLARTCGPTWAARASSTISIPIWHLVVGGLNQDATRNINTPVNNLTNNNGNYTSSLANGFAPRFVMTSDTAYLDGNFITGSIAHDLTVGTAGYNRNPIR